MPDPRLAAALERIARAVERLEGRPPHDPALPARHARLRAAIAETVTGLDRLIAAEEA